MQVKRVLLSEQSVTLFLSVINGDLGIMNSNNLVKIQHLHREEGWSVSRLTC